MNPTRRSFLRQLGVGAAGLSLAHFNTGCHSPQAGTGATLLPRSTPEAEGISSAAILQFLAAAEARHELHSFMLLRHGRVVAEGWWTPYGPAFNHTLYSLSKSFTSTAVGLAVAEGRLTVDDRVVSFFPADLPAPVSENLAALRVRDLLCMAVGNEKEPTQAMVVEENWAKAFLASPITHPPGSTFMYNSGATYLCSAIVQQVTGQRVVDYLQPRLFAPLLVSAVTGIGFRLGKAWFDIPTPVARWLLRLHQGSYLGKDLRVVYVLLLGIGALALLGTGLARTGLRPCRCTLPSSLS